MWKQSLTRLILLGLGVVVALLVLKNLVGRQSQSQVSLKLPEVSVENIEPENILKTASQMILGVKKEDETEPITEPVENIEQQTQNLIEMIKKLPEDQLEAVKKQIFKEFCQKLLESD